MVMILIWSWWWCFWWICSLWAVDLWDPRYSLIMQLMLKMMLMMMMATMMLMMMMVVAMMVMLMVMLVIFTMSMWPVRLQTQYILWRDLWWWIDHDHHHHAMRDTQSGNLWDPRHSLLMRLWCWFDHRHPEMEKAWNIAQMNILAKRNSTKNA